MQDGISEDITLQEEKNYSFYGVIKRVFDILFCTILFLLTVPILFVICILVFLQDGKNPIYVQKRVGIGNREFKMYKVRSMIANAEKDGAKWADENDNRITIIGRFIRKTRIDELPQLLNVIEGEMSLIGPRPEREIFYKEFEKDIPNYRERLSVKPGITGYAQVSGGYDLTPKEKLKLDLYYIKNKSLILDLKIILRTIFIVFTGEGAR